MYKQYIKQAIHLLRENKLLSIISIIGTALAISIIMVIIILLRAKTADYVPEVNRSRTLYVKWASAVKKGEEGHRNYNRLSYYDIREAFYPLTIPEAVSGVCPYGSMLLSVPGSEDETNSELMYTDAAFWKVYEFAFLAGRPYDQASFEAGLKQAVVCESTARKLYGGANEAVGKHVDVNFVEYTIVGVVKDVSKFAEMSYAEIWVPYTANAGLVQVNTSGWGNGHTGGFICFILAHSSDDFDKIREEVKVSIAKLNDSSPEFYLDIMEQPADFFHQMLTKFANGGSSAGTQVIRYVIIILLILLIPSVNLSGLTQSRMRKRLSEIGVRKAFGANRQELMAQFLWENFMLTLIGGFIGLAFSYFSLGLLSNWLLASDLGGVAVMNASMISPWIFLIALAFCILLNLLSVGIPAWRASRTTIVNALNE